MDEELKAVVKLNGAMVEDQIEIAGVPPAKLWLRPLTYPVEKSVALAHYREAYRLMREAGASEEDANSAGNMAYMVKTIMLSAKSGPKPTDKPFFDHARQAMAMPEQVQRLFELYVTSFEITEEDLGEWLRAKTTS